MNSSLGFIHCDMSSFMDLSSITRHTLRIPFSSTNSESTVDVVRSFVINMAMRSGYPMASPEIFRARKFVPGTSLRMLRIIPADKWPAGSLALLIHTRLEDCRITCFKTTKSSSVMSKRRHSSRSTPAPQ